MFAFTFRVFAFTAKYGFQMRLLLSLNTVRAKLSHTGALSHNTQLCLLWRQSSKSLVTRLFAHPFKYPSIVLRWNNILCVPTIDACLFLRVSAFTLLSSVIADGNFYITFQLIEQSATSPTPELPDKCHVTGKRAAPCTFLSEWFLAGAVGVCKYFETSS